MRSNDRKCTSIEVHRIAVERIWFQSKYTLVLIKPHPNKPYDLKHLELIFCERTKLPYVEHSRSHPRRLEHSGSNVLRLFNVGVIRFKLYKSWLVFCQFLIWVSSRDSQSPRARGSRVGVLFSTLMKKVV